VGNWGPWVVGPSVRFGARDDAASGVRRSIGWTTISYRYAYAKTVSRTTRTGASWRTTVSARTLALVAPVGPRQGWVDVYVDGVRQNRVSLWASTGSSRQVLWVKTFSADARRVVELRAVRTTARWRVDIDALLVGRY
jgi:hypothetical protein